jgi:RHS repeat-associated protein
MTTAPESKSTTTQHARRRTACAPRSLPVWLQAGVVLLLLWNGLQAIIHHNGSSSTTTDQTAPITPQARYDYDPYGRTTANMQPTFQYAGYYAHAPGTVTVTQVHAYAPSTGRWLSRDPLPNAEKSQGPNLYEYVHNDPIDMTDPLGLKTCWKYVIMTNYGDSPGDKVGNHDNKLGPGDAAVGYNNPSVPHTGNGPGSMPGPGATPVLPMGTQVTTYPDTGGSSNVTVNDIGNYDKVHPDLAPSPSDFIDIWNPKKSKHGDSTEGWISIEVDKCKDCPPGWSG